MEEAKRAVGKKAVEFIENGMIVGLGTGTTVFYFIENLIQACKQGLKIKAVASSSRSLDQAQNGGISILDSNTISSIDITVDGADEIDPHKQMIKGGGGALLREKIVASMSREMIVIVDESKLSKKLGSRKLPVEIVPFGHTATLHRLENLGYHGTLRLANGLPYITENGNLIYDIQLHPEKTNPRVDHGRILQLPGVVDTGFFLDFAGRVIIGFFDGQIVVQ